jgi:hypothetical protein
VKTLVNGLAGVGFLTEGESEKVNGNLMEGQRMSLLAERRDRGAISEEEYEKLLLVERRARELSGELVNHQQQWQKQLQEEVREAREEDERVRLRTQREEQRKRGQREQEEGRLQILRLRVLLFLKRRRWCRSTGHCCREGIRLVLRR